MKKNIFSAFCSFLLLCPCVAFADSSTKWTFGESTQKDRYLQVNATSFSVTQSGETAPKKYQSAFSVGCKAGIPHQWSQWIHLSNPIEAGDSLQLTVTIDGNPLPKEPWALGFEKRFLVLHGLDQVERLRAAKNMQLSWAGGTSKVEVKLNEFSKALESLKIKCEALPTPSPSPDISTETEAVSE